MPNKLEEWKKQTPDVLTAGEVLENNITGEELLENDMTVEKALEEDFNANELKKEIVNWSKDKQINFLRRIVNEGDWQRKNASENAKMSGIIVRAVKLAKANDMYKQKIEALQDRVEELQ